jgi:RNA polymerase sigma-70 factor (ECF subfamily)
MPASLASPPPPLFMPASADGASGSAAAERAIVVAAQGGSNDAFSALVRIHQRRAYAIVRAIVLSHEDAEDAVQEGFLHAHRALDRIMANAALDLVRRRKVRDADELPESIPMPFRDPAESGELRERLKRALMHLTDRQRAVIVMHDVEGFTHGEIGRTLGIPEGTARSDLHHARAALRRLLQDIRSTS